MSEVTAYITVENGQVVLHDPAAEGIIAAVKQHNRDISYENCKKVFELNAESVERFKSRFTKGVYNSSEYCIVIIQVDDPYGGPISDVLMPDCNWQSLRDQGLEPMARGIADRAFMRSAIAAFDQEAVSDQDMLKDDLIAIVVAQGVARVFAV